MLEEKLLAITGIAFAVAGVAWWLGPEVMQQLARRVARIWAPRD